MPPPRITRAFLLAVVWVTMATASTAQTTTATVQGTITDATGAALPDASVVITGETASRSVRSDARGFYRVSSLPAGVYVLTASREGFLTTVIDTLSLVIDRTSTLDLRLTIEGPAAAVTVSARRS